MELATTLLVADDIRAHDVGGHQVRRELDAREAHRQSMPEGANQDGLAEAGDALEQDGPAGDQRDDRVADQGLVSDDEPGQLVLGGLREFGHPGRIDARFFGDHDPPRRGNLFGSGRTLLTQLREILADEVTLAARDETLVRGIERGLLVGLDHLAVGAQRHVLPGSQRGRIVLRPARYRLAGHVDPLGGLHAGARARSRTTRSGAAGSAGSTGAVAAAAASAGPRTGPGAAAVPVAVPTAIAIPTAAGARAWRRP